MAFRYRPTCATPHSPFDVSLHAGVAVVASTAVIVHLVALPLLTGVAIVALSVVLATLLRRRWRRLVGSDPRRDLYMVLFAPMWGTAALMLSVIVAATILGGDVKPPPPWGMTLFFGVGSSLPSVWAASWFASAAARGGPAPPGSMQRRLVRAGLWRTTAVILWPIEYFGMFDSMRSRASLAAALTLACWGAVVAVGVVHLAARRGMQLPAAERSRPEARVEEPYREPGERSHLSSVPPEEAGLRAALKRELRGDLIALIAISVPLAGHALLLVFTP